MTTWDGNQNLWVYEWERDTMSPLTLDPAHDAAPVWSPGGEHIAFESERDGGTRNLYWMRADGAGQVQRLTDSRNEQGPCSFSPDGRRLAFHEDSPETGWDIWTLPIEGDADSPRTGEAELFLGTRSNERRPAFSPDARWIAYESDESGAAEVYVRPFPGPGGKWLISSGGGMFPVWSPSGRELFYWNPDGRIFAVNCVARDDLFAADKPRVWSETKIGAFSISRTFDIAPDGKQFAVRMAAEDTGGREAPTHVTFLLNFFDELKRRVPVE
jgi:serine/threonine-protein kinase